MIHSTRSPFVAAACGAVAVIGLGLFSTLAFAVSPLAIDADGDGAYIAVVDVNADGTLDHLDIGVKATAYDCDDAHKAIHPGATEIVGDGLDQDCVGGDATFPVADPVVARYKATYGSSWDDLRFIAEYARCKASANCSEDDVDGTFTVADGYQFVDLITGELPSSREFSAVRIRPDGVRDVLSDTEVEYAKAHSAAAKPRSSGMGKKEVTKIADKSAEDAVRPLREEFLIATGELRAVDTVLAQGIDRLWRADEDLAEGLAALDRARIEADAAEEAARIEADRILAEAADKAQRKAEKAERDAGKALEAGETAQSHGPLVEGYGQGGIVAGRGTVAAGRNPLGFGGGAGVNFGLDGSGYRVNGFADLLVGVDGGAGPAHSESVGAEATFAIGDSDVHVGPHLAWSTRTSQSDALAAAVVGRNPLVGLTVAAPFGGTGAGHGLFQVRAGCGPEFVGTATGAAREQLEPGLGCRATVGIGGGVGALRR